MLVVKYISVKYGKFVAILWPGQLLFRRSPLDFALCKRTEEIL